MIYLDNNSTTRILPEIQEEMVKYIKDYYGNPSSKYYELAQKSAMALDDARRRVAELFLCSVDEVIFTSGSSESNNFIIKGIADLQKDKKHIITSCVEHPSVLETMRYLELKGFDITYLPVQNDGTVCIDELISAIREDTFLVSIMWVHNELGSINDIEKIADICQINNLFFHVDATQAVGKIDVSLPKGVTFASMSAHKINGPKGIGAAIVKKNQHGIPIRLTPLIHGGEQENGYRAGTQAVHDIVGLGAACKIAKCNLEKNHELLRAKEKFVINLLKTKLGDKLVINNDFGDKKVLGVVNFQIKGVKSEIFLNKISCYIAASSGSACSITKPSYTLKSIGLSSEEIKQSIRFSISPYDDISELEEIL